MAEALVSRRRVLTSAGIAGAAGLAALAPTVALAAPQELGTDPILGSWEGTVSVTGGPSFAAMSSFGVGGIVQSSASVDLTPGELSTPGYGAWKRTAPGSYTVRFRFFTFANDGTPSGTGQVDAQATLGGDTLSGPFTLTLSDPTGTTVFTAAGSISLTRIVVG